MAEIQEITVELFGPVFYLFLPQSRFFGLYFLSAAVIALAVVYLRQRGAGGRSFRAAFATVFSARVYLHPSALLDYRYLLVNHLVQTLALGFFLVSAVTVARGGVDLLGFLFGEPGPLGMPGPLAGLFFTLAMLLAADAGLFLVHWLHHKNLTLWEFHKVHHSAEAMTPLTVLRTHPVETLLNKLAQALLIGGANAVFLYLYRGPAAQVTLIGANAFAFLFWMAGYHLRHSHVWILFPRGIREHISSPALHQIHHSKDPRHYDKNFARIFNFWDRIAGTLYIPERFEEIEFGLGEADQAELRTVWQLFATPFRKTAARFARPASGQESFRPGPGRVESPPAPDAGA